MPPARHAASPPPRGGAPAAGAGSHAELRAAALAHVARFAASEADLVRVLERRVARWSRQALRSGGDPESVRRQQCEAESVAVLVAAELAQAGTLDDAFYADARVRRLVRAGRSIRSIQAHLAGHGVDGGIIEQAIRTAQSEAAGSLQRTAALIQTRKRRIGPFAGPAAPDAAPLARQRALAILARAGFSHEVAVAALDTDRETAETLIAELRAR